MTLQANNYYRTPIKGFKPDSLHRAKTIWS
nr:MAG TPA: hypothetical protein [Caudoviricetes sp.]